MDNVVLLGIGLLMGLFGGLLGIGGSIIMIPALTLLYGENQHLYQAAAMICNFFVAASSLIGHWRAEAFVGRVLRWIIPAAVFGVMGGVWLSNLPVFAGHNSFWLARLFGGFLIYVAVYNLSRFWARPRILTEMADRPSAVTALISASIGAVTGIGAGLLGIGAGTVSTPLQQVTMKIPLRNAMSNSAAIIVSIAWLGAFYKNATLPDHDLEILRSVEIAALVLPTGILGGYLGSHLMHKLPRNLIRGFFVAVCFLAAWKLLTVQPGS